MVPLAVGPGAFLLTIAANTADNVPSVIVVGELNSLHPIRERLAIGELDLKVEARGVVRFAVEGDDGIPGSVERQRSDRSRGNTAETLIDDEDAAGLAAFRQRGRKDTKAVVTAESFPIVAEDRVG